MRALAEKLKRRASQEEGAYLIEFLGGLVLTVTLIALVVQLVIVLIAAVVFNNALQAAGQEASVQGGPSDQVVEVWKDSLPRGMCDAGVDGRCTSATLSVSSKGLPITPPAKDRRGRESTNFGEVLAVNADYQMSTPLFGLLGVDSIDFNRTTFVSSQSSKES